MISFPGFTVIAAAYWSTHQFLRVRVCAGTRVTFWTSCCGVHVGTDFIRLLKPFSDWMALPAPQLGRRNGNLGCPQVVPLVAGRTTTRLGTTHGLVGIVRDIGRRRIEEAAEGTGLFLLLSRCVVFFFFQKKNNKVVVILHATSRCLQWVQNSFTLWVHRGQGWEHIVLPLPFSYPWFNILPAAGQARKLSQGPEMANTLSVAS